MRNFVHSLILLMHAANKLVRPYLTIMIATAYNVVLIWAVCTAMLPIRDYIVAVGPTNSMLMGFWFAERAALKNPNNPDPAPVFPGPTPPPTPEPTEPALLTPEKKDDVVPESQE